MTVVVRRLGGEEWEVLRAVRLAALADAPYAFRATLDDERVQNEATWRERVGDQAWFVAFDDEAPVGVASGGQLREPDPGVRTLRSMWVEAAHRGEGVAHRLVEAVVDWARGDGARELTLWALDAASRAQAFYARAGFSVLPATSDGLAGSHPAMTRYSLAL
ncbi:MAG TPA: GNAT family N-acetyltransferase [Acidimicrobiales bacterium]|nr:GNAT family N-acetyltransferase [Acidimicrobiales bacterium]